MKKSLPILGIILFVVVTSKPSLAEAPTTDASKPTVVVAFSGYDELVRNADFIGELAGIPELANKLEDQIKDRLKLKDLVGLDKARPWGFITMGKGAPSSRLAFIPVTDLGQLLQSIEPKVGKPVDVGDGVSEIVVRGQTISVREKKGWAFFTDSVETLDHVPDDPTQVVADLIDHYDIGLQVSVKSIPPFTRQLALVGLQMMAQNALNNAENVSNRERKMQSLFLRRSIQSINRTLSNTDTIRWGFSLDRDQPLGIAEFSSVLLKKAAVNRRLTQIKPIKSPLAGFTVPDAIVRFNSTMQLSKNFVADLSSKLLKRRNLILDELRKESLNISERNRAKQMIDQIVGVIQETLDKGRIDVAVAVQADPDGNTIVAGVHLADPLKFEKLFKQAFQRILDENPDVAKNVTMDDGEHLGVRFLSMSVSLDDLEIDPRMTEIIGHSQDMVFGFSKKYVYFSCGNHPMKTLKRALDEAHSTGSRPVLPFQVVVEGGVVARKMVASSQGEARESASKIADLLEQTDGKNHLSITGACTDKGTHVRVELHEGLLKLLGSLPTLTQSK